MSRSLKNLYPSKYEEFKKSDVYKLKNSNQIEKNLAKEECKKKVDYICQICGKPHASDAHHIIPIESGGSNDQNNLICLCRSCHQQVHKDVYKFNYKSLKFEPNIKESDIIDPKTKQKYVLDFENANNVTLYRSTGGYYMFVDGVKAYLSVSEIKAATNYKPESIKTMSPEKAQSIKDRQMIRYLASEYKAQGDKYKWHRLCQIANDWDSYSKDIQEQLIKAILKN